LYDKEDFMSNAVKTIGVLTSGGDAPGMNAAIRAVVRTGISCGLKIKGIRHGFAGLLEEDIIDMNNLSVSDIIQTGGTILYTARCLEFKKKEYQEKGAEICRKHGIDGVVVIGGDGSFNGASRLAENGINTVGVPGTIDLDIACTEYTIGFDTAINTAMEAIDKLRDTSESHERCTIVEVMGRTAGHIALWTGIASGAEYILTTEKYHGDIQRIIAKILDRRKLGKKNHIIVNAEGIGSSTEMAKLIELATGIETRATILGHIQRGGNPTCKDRVYASALGTKAVELLCEGKTNRVVGYKSGEFVDFDIQEALAMTKDLDPYLFHITHRLTTK
jgi:6-phosphofructokinase